jgi:hypothetical protein
MSEDGKVIAFPSGNRDTVTHPEAGLTLEVLAQAKLLPVEELRSYGCRDARRDGVSRVQIPYLDEQGMTKAVRYRWALAKIPGQADGRFLWRRGDKAQHLYGLDRLQTAREVGWVLLVEGESDCWTGWHYDLPIVGVPGKSTWKSHMAAKLTGLEVYVWQEPDAEDFAERIGSDLPQIKVIVAPEGLKDISDAHVAGYDVTQLVEQLRLTALPFTGIRAQRRDEQLPRLCAAARDILAVADPLEAVRDALLGLGYGGDPTPAIVVYLAASGRVLAMRRGTMPVHLLILGPPSAGKSYTLSVVLALMPEEAYHVIDAGSPSVMIYDNAELVHRVVVFSEADSLPAGEDSPAASAIRNLLQDHRLQYAVTVRSLDTGDFVVREVEKPGPTTLVTTSTRRLGPQLDTRVFTLEVPDDQNQIGHALRAQAAVELAGGAVEPPAELLAFQSYLQALAPWEVVVPFADRLAAHLASQPGEARVVRDYARLLSLIKACAVLRHVHRHSDADGRLVAELADYETVYRLVGEIYKTSASGAGEKVRAVVAAVAAHLADGYPHASVTEVARRLAIPKKSAARRVGTALKGGWLVNSEARKGYPFQLAVGEPLPSEGGLPTPGDLGCVTVSAPTEGHSDTEPSERPAPKQMAAFGAPWEGEL